AMRPADRRKRRASRHERTRAQRAATAGRLASLGSNFAVLDDVRAWAAAAGVVVAAGWEGRAAGRRRLRVVAVEDVITGPPVITSLPKFPNSVSLSGPPVITSLSGPPKAVSSPGPPAMVSTPPIPISVELLPGPRVFDLVIAAVSLPLGAWLALT